MNRNHLALFQAVAETGGISRAAEAAHVSQPAVSKQIAELESALGVRLLERLPRGCRLTEAGAVLAEYARRWLAVERDAERAMQELRGLKRGRLGIGASLTIGGYLIPRIAAEFHRRHPQVELRLEIANTQRIERLLQDGAIELGFTEGPLATADLVSRVFAHDELVPVAPAGHPLLRSAGVTLREFCRAPFILREEGSGTRAVVERALRGKGVRVQPVLSVASPEAIKNLVAAGLGVSILSRLVVELDLRVGSLGIVPVKNFVIRRPLHLQYRSNWQPSPAGAGFLALVDQISGAPAP